MARSKSMKVLKDNEKPFEATLGSVKYKKVRETSEKKDCFLNFSNKNNSIREQLNYKNQSTSDCFELKTDLNEEILLCGHLNELTTKNYWLITCLNWKKRFCILYENKLIIQDRKTTKICKILNLDNLDCSLVNSNKFGKQNSNVFVLNFSTSLLKLQYTFAAETEEEMRNWVSILQKTIKESFKIRKLFKQKSVKTKKENVKLSPIVETKVLNVVTKDRPKGPQGRKLPNRQRTLKTSTKSSLNKSNSKQHSSNKNINCLEDSDLINSTNKIIECNNCENDLNFKNLEEPLNQSKNYKLRANSMSILDDDILTGNDLVDNLKENKSKLQLKKNSTNDILNEMNDKNSINFKQQLTQQLKMYNIEKTKTKYKSLTTLKAKSNECFNESETFSLTNDFLINNKDATNNNYLDSDHLIENLNQTIRKSSFNNKYDREKIKNIIIINNSNSIQSNSRNNSLTSDESSTNDKFSINAIENCKLKKFIKNKKQDSTNNINSIFNDNQYSHLDSNFNSLLSNDCNDYYANQKIKYNTKVNPALTKNHLTSKSIEQLKTINDFSDCGNVQARFLSKRLSLDSEHTKTEFIVPTFV